MPLLNQLCEGLVVLVVTYVLFQAFRAFVAKTSLHNIPGPPISSHITGHLRDVFNSNHGWDFVHDVYTHYGAVVRIGGMFNKPMLYVFDPKALHNVLIKDQYIFEKPPFSTTLTKLVFGTGLLSTAGDHHRAQRKMLNPVFSIKHMRDMTAIFYRVSHNLRDALRNQVKDGAKDVDILNWLGRTALELIGQGGLGYSFDPLVEDVPNPFGDAIKALVPSLQGVFLVRPFLEHLVKLGSPSFRRLLVELVPSARVREMVRLTDTLNTECQHIYDEKKAALKAGDAAVLHQVAEGKDIMSIMLKANMNAKVEDRLPEEELIGQMSTLVFAATDTTSSALSRILDLLSQNQAVQDKLRQEVSDASNGEDISYDELVSLPYLDAICRETLRLFPPVNQITRANNEDVVLPLSNPIRGLDGKLMHEIFVPKGTTVFVGILASNRNPALWGEDAMEWKPERWLKPLPEAVGEAHLPGVYSNLLTFNGGGRSCIGFKFSQLEMKVVLSLLVSSFKFSPPDKPEDVIWNFAGVNYPSVKGEANKPAMPMKVQLA